MKAGLMLALGALGMAACFGEPESAAVETAAATKPEAEPAARDTRAPAAAPCAITGESTDVDPQGLRVREGPVPQSRILGRLHPGMDPEVRYHHESPSLGGEGLVGARFTIDRVFGDWLRITEIDPITDGVHPRNDLELTPPNFQGSGWVHASRVRVIPAQDGLVRERPDTSARAIDSPEFFNPSDARLRIVACRERWAGLEYRPARAGDRASPRHRVLRGWVLSEPNTSHAATMRAALQDESSAR